MAIFYMDYINGNDSTSSTPLGWWSIAYTNGNGTTPTADMQATGGTSGSTAKLTVAPVVSGGTWAGGNASGTLYWYGKSAAFQSETLTFTNGATCSIASDFTYCAWKTMTSGALAARTAPGDTIRVAKTKGYGATSTTGLSSDTGADTPGSLGSGIWTGVASGVGGIPAAISITSSTNATPIVVTKASHGFVNGDIIQIIGHATNTAANGEWVVANKTDSTFELAGSVGNGIGGATGTVRKINTQVVYLDTKCTDTIDKCNDSAWTSNDLTNITVTADTSVYKTGGYSMKAVFGANAGTGLAAYKTITSTNFSARKQISFWFRTSVALAANDLKVCLCSDTGGTTIVDTANIPAINALNKWIPITVNTGGALGTAIQSVALYQNSDKGAMTVYLDNIIACNDATAADSLTLTSLISKSSTEQTSWDGEQWFTIQNINDRIIVLDGAAGSFPGMASDYNRGYYGSSGAATTYKREVYQLTSGASTSTNIETTNEAGTYGNQISWNFGYDTDSNTQTGETWISAGAGNGYFNIGHGYHIFTRLGVVNFYNGIYVNGNGITLTNIFSVGAAYQAFTSTGVDGGTWTNISANTALTTQIIPYSIITNYGVYNCQTSPSIYLTTQPGTTIKGMRAYNNYTGLLFITASMIYLYDYIGACNNSYDIGLTNAIIEHPTIYNATLSSTTPVSFTGFSNLKLKIHNYGHTLGRYKTWVGKYYSYTVGGAGSVNAGTISDQITAGKTSAWAKGGSGTCVYLDSAQTAAGKELEWDFWIPVTSGTSHTLKFYITKTAASWNGVAKVYVYDSADNYTLLINGETITNASIPQNTGSGSTEWTYQYATAAFTPNDTGFSRVVISILDGSTTGDILIDDISVV